MEMEATTVVVIMTIQGQVLVGAGGLEGLAEASPAVEAVAVSLAAVDSEVLAAVVLVAVEQAEAGDIVNLISLFKLTDHQ